MIPKKQKPYFFSRNKALKCRGGEIRTPDLLLPKEESLGLILVDKIKCIFARIFVFLVEIYDLFILNKYKTNIFEVQLWVGLNP